MKDPIVAVVVWVQSLAQKLLNAVGVGPPPPPPKKKRKKKEKGFLLG